jgi:hypothetical protein
MKSNYKILLAAAFVALTATYVYYNWTISIDQLDAADRTDRNYTKEKHHTEIASQETSGSAAAANSAEDVAAQNIKIQQSPSRTETQIKIDTSTKRSNDSNFPDTDPFAVSTENPNSILDSYQSDRKYESSRVVHDEQNRLSDNFLVAALDDDLDESPELVTVEFTFSPLPGVRYLPNPAVVELFDTVYATILPSQRCATCIFKWRHQVSAEIEILATTSLHSNRLHTVFVTPDNGWRKGQYVLSVYDASESNQLIGRGSVQILDVLAETQASTPDFEFINALLNNGHASAKTALIPETYFEPEAIALKYEHIQRLLDSGQAISKTN